MARDSFIINFKDVSVEYVYEDRKFKEANVVWCSVSPSKVTPQARIVVDLILDDVDQYGIPSKDINLIDVIYYKN